MVSVPPSVWDRTENTPPWFTAERQFILDNLDAIITINAAPLHENQGKHWEQEEDT